MCTTEREETLLYIWSHDPRPKRIVTAIIGSKDSVTAAVQVARGELVFDFIQTILGEKVTGQIVQGGELVTLPRGFWPRCCHECFHRVCTLALRKALRKALVLHIISLKRGACTFAGKLGDQKAQQKRSPGGAQNRLKCPELGQLLYDWFIDCLQRYRARIDGYLFCRQAQYLAQRLHRSGYPLKDLPKLSGRAWISWFYRWRVRFSVESRKTVKHLKVSPDKLKERVRVYLEDRFAFPMRLLS